jgi:hypothetical protein
MKKVIVLLALLLVLTCWGANSQRDIDSLGVFFKTDLENSSTPYFKDFSFTEVPNPLSGKNPTYFIKDQEVPVCGKSFRDQYFKTQITRVTEQKGIRHEYARFDPFNADQSMILIHFPESGDFKAFRTETTPYESEANFVRIIDMEESRWDPDDPDVIWGTEDFSIFKINLKTGDRKAVKDFTKDSKIGPIIKAEPDLYRITMKNEGETSTDKRFWALALQGSEEDYRLRYIFSWDRIEDRVLGVLKLSLAEAELIDWIGMSPKGTWVLIGGDSGEGKTAGLVIANKELTEFHQIAHATAHSDVGLDSEGKEIIVMQNTRTDHLDLLPLDPNTKPMPEESEDYEGTNLIPLMRLFYSSDSPDGFNCGIHVSCNCPGYCLISTYIEPGIKEQNWLDRSIVLVKLDRENPRVFYLAKVHNTTQEYWEETQATISNDGSKVVWASNWNQNVGEEKLFLLQLDMPDDWTSLITK